MRILRPAKGGRGHIVEYDTFTHKKCSKCKRIKPVSAFTTSIADTKQGWAYRSYCRMCSNKCCSRYAKANRPKRNARLRRWRKNNPDAAKLKDKRAHYKRAYGLSFEQYKQMLSLSDNQCWICQRPRERLFVDHCHKTGKVRGVLCATCNTFLGVIGDNVLRAARVDHYLRGMSEFSDGLSKILLLKINEV